MRKPADIRKSEILASALALADRLGPDRVTTGAVAAEVGVTQAALFRHFPSKAALWASVAEHVSERLSAAWARARDAESEPVQRLSALILAQLREIAATPAMPMLLFSRELNVENEGLRLSFRDLLLSFRTMLEREVAEAQRAGALRRDVKASDAALLLTSLVQGLAIRWALGARDFPIEREGARLLKVHLRLLAASGD